MEGAISATQQFTTSSQMLGNFRFEGGLKMEGIKID